MYCLLPALLDALDGAPPAHPSMLRPPPQLLAPSRPPDRSGERAVCGNNYAFHQETEHFTIQWEDAAVPQARVDEIGERLEAAWTYFGDQGWQLPPYADSCYLWFILDTTMSGSGLTTLYYNDDFPEGYPVTFLHPTYVEQDYPGFAVSVAVHEFAHMLQFTVEDYFTHRDRTWYWEASAEWMAEKTAPDLDWYADSTWWYADFPDGDYNTTANFHPYGMLGLNAWIDQRVGFGAITDAWQTAAQHDEGWDLRIARATGQDFASLVADFSGAYAAAALTESSLYWPPVREAAHTGVPDREKIPLPGLYGSYYIDIERADAPLAWGGDVAARFVAGGAWSDTPPASGDYTAIFTATATPGTFWYGRSAGGDTGDTGAGGPEDTGAGGAEDPGGKTPRACASAAPGPSGASLPASSPGLLSLGLLVAIRRRRA